MTNTSNVRTILATDCGSTTTKAILIEKKGDEYRLTTRGEAPTTVEAPFDDVTIGVSNAAREIEELSGRTILDANGQVITPTAANGDGVDLYLSTSSAGGGLQMTVAGVVKSMSAESAERAALGAGAIIMDVIAVDDGRKDYQKVERIRALRPDMILMSGGTDGGTVTHLTEMAEMLRSADPKPRLGIGLKLPVIFAGNVEARKSVHDVAGDIVDIREVPNLRPTLDRENLGPAREAIHDLFLEHVMQQAPGYAKLTTWTSSGIMSTPNAVGKIMETIARERKIDVLGVDIGGATTDVFSVFGGVFNRTVSANLGMSYSICNVLTEAGIANIARWIPFMADDAYLRNQLRNKMIRPTTIPQSLRDLQIEQAVAREALRLAFEHHKSLARGLKGVQTKAGVEFEREATGKTLVNMIELDMIIGSGGVLSHAPERAQSALMMLDAYQPEGVTMLAVDSIFMMPQLGVLSTILPEAATQVFERDCLIKLGHVVAPIGTAKEGEPCLTVVFKDSTSEVVPFGQLRLIPLKENETQEATITPARNFDVGAGKGKPITVTLEGGVVGLILDTRGRPVIIPSEPTQRVAKLQEWLRAIGLTVHTGSSE
ncbi:MAG: glutamate mutase L [Capsulimonas sp.]|uniref:glutamate mutase L n=1 Tax=Capsulimonas sp. TaxID=2494211 RepID=UPI0032634537